MCGWQNISGTTNHFYWVIQSILKQNDMLLTHTLHGTLLGNHYKRSHNCLVLGLCLDLCLCLCLYLGLGLCRCLVLGICIGPYHCQSYLHGTLLGNHCNQSHQVDHKQENSSWKITLILELLSFWIFKTHFMWKRRSHLCRGTRPPHWDTCHCTPCKEEDKSKLVQNKLKWALKMSLYVLQRRTFLFTQLNFLWLFSIQVKMSAKVVIEHRVEYIQAKVKL